MKFCDVKLEETVCPQCGSSAYTKLFYGKDRLHNLPGEFWVVKCSDCCLMRTNPRPTTDTMGFYYPDDYGPYLTTRQSYEPSEIRRRPFWKRCLKKLIGNRDLWLGQAIPPGLQPGRALEIGCASGYYLDVLAQNGWQVEGIEFSPVAAEAARNRGYNVYAGSLESAPEPENKFDLVVGWMVIEHLHKPKEGLKRLAQWTNEAGWLAFSIPDCGYLGFRVFRSYEYGLHLPAHLVHLTPEAISIMLENCGWSVEKIMHQRVMGSVAGSIGFFLRDGLGMNNRLTNSLINYDIACGKVNLLLYPLTLLLAWFGQTGRITVWAKKKSP